MQKSEIEKKIDEMANADKTLTQMLMPAILGIVLCMVCLCACTWAWFTATPVSSGASTITAGNFTVNIHINNVLLPTEGTESISSIDYIKSTAELEPGVYEVRLSTPSSLGVKGYIIVTVDGQPYLVSPQFGQNMTDEIVFHVHVGEERRGNKVNIGFYYRWGPVPSDNIMPENYKLLEHGTIIDKKVPIITMITDSLVVGPISFQVEDVSEVQVTVTRGEEPVSITAGENKTYQFTATKTGSYLITATDINGNFITKTIEVNKPPTITMITDPLVVGPISFKVENESGVQTVTVTKGEQSVDTTGGENGIYHFVVTESGIYSITAIDIKGNRSTEEIEIAAAPTSGAGTQTGTEAKP